MGILMKNTKNATEIEALRDKAIEERRKIEEMRSEIEKKRAGLISDREALRHGGTIGKARNNKKVDAMDLDHIALSRSSNTITGLTDQIKKCDEALKVDPFYYTDYRKALIEYLHALEGHFDEKWLPLREERIEIGKEVTRIEKWREDCQKREYDIDTELDAMLIEVGCNGAVFTVERTAYDLRKVFLSRLLGIENEE